ncbi:MAG: Tm-1-like ATP-binding domain-containing protein [Thermodesulfobacteriota bacterium]
MSKQKTVLIIATLDTKGLEALFLKNLLEERGVGTLVMDIGTTGKALFSADVPSRKVADAASRTLEELLSFDDEAKAMAEMAKGAESVVQGIFKTAPFDGVLAIGGSMGSSLALRVFRGLPAGLTKVLLSTVALSDFVTPQSVMNDVVLVQATCDLWGMNRLEKRDLKKAALTVASMVQSEEEPAGDSAPLIAMTTLGGSFLKYATPVKEALEKKGYEVAVFHSVSSSMQGALMEKLIREGKVHGVLDLCPQGVLAEVSGMSRFSPGRLEAASEKGIPQIIGPGGLGFFSVGALKDLPERFKGRLSFAHNEIASGVQATVEEMAETGKVIASRLNRSHGLVAVVIPERGFMEYDRPGGKLHYPEGRKAFVHSLMEYLRSDIEFIRMDCHINDPAYADAVTQTALRLFNEAAP